MKPIWGLALLSQLATAYRGGDVLHESFKACPKLEVCWRPYLEARRSPLWSEKFFRCGQLESYWNCAEPFLNEDKKYADISLRLIKKVHDECEDGDETEIDLTAVVQLDHSKAVEMIAGNDDFPTFRFKPGHNQALPAIQVFPRQLYEDFTILANIRPDYNGGVLFAITDAYRRITFFGLELRAEADGQIQVNVYWTDEDQEQTQLGQVWDFNADSSQSKWLKFAITVSGQTAMLHTGCNMGMTKSLQRSEPKLNIKANYNFYLAKGDNYMRHFIGDIQELRIVEGTEAADDYFCADDAVETRTQFPNSLADEPEASGDFNFFDDQISDDEEVGNDPSRFIFYDEVEGSADGALPGQVEWDDEDFFTSKEMSIPNIIIPVSPSLYWDEVKV